MEKLKAEANLKAGFAKFSTSIFSASFLSDFQSDQGLWILGETLQLKDPTDSFHILFLLAFWPLLGGDFFTLYKMKKIMMQKPQAQTGF